MVLHLDKEHALLEWVNHLNVDLPVRSINDLQDGVLLLKLVYKLRKEEPAKSYLDQPIQERLKVVSDFLQGDCRCSTERGALISWDNISNGLNLEVELSKVLVLLYYHSVINNHVDLNQLEYKFEVELASMLRFVLDNENSLYLSENLEKYLRKKPLFSFNSDISSTSSSSLFNDEESPVFRRRKKIGSVQFLDLQTVASSSVSSPLQDVMNTPQFQLKKLQRQLRQERDMRDELEKDLTTSAATLTQRESQICQLQHRIEKLLREQAEQEQEPRDELQELHSKNEGLRTRLHEVLKECQALKTNSSQMERKVDNLTEENGTLSAQMREVIARLASAEAEVDRLTEAQDSAQGEWSSRHCHLQAELNRATAQKECLNEQMLILQSKISSLEDELSKAKMQEKGEVMGPILEWEQLKQELADATLRHAECECTIARLKGEKEQAATLHAQERASLQAESQRLQVLVTELQEALSALRVDREALELASKEERESLTAQLHTLTAEVASLTQTVQQREQEVQQECIQRGELNLAMEWQERKAREEIQELTSHVDTMGDSLRRAEEEVQVREKQLTKQQQESALQREVLQEEMAAAEKVLKELKEQEEAVREEATRLHQEITTHATNLCSLRQEHTALQEQLARQQEEISLEKEAQSEAHREKEAVREELSRLQEELRSLGEQMAQLEEAQREKECLLLQSTENIETLKTERATASSLAEAKDLELSSLREEVRAREEQLAMQQEEYRLQQEELREELAAQENEINNMRERLAGLMDQISLLKELCQEGKNMEALREEHTAQLEQLRIVKEQVEEVQERNEETSAALREKESSLREKEESLRRLEEELQSTTSLASQRRQEELTSLKEEVISQQEEVERRRAAEALSVEEARQLAREQESKRMELEESVSALQQQLDSAIQDNDRKRQECERLEQDLEHRGTRVEELRQQEDSARLEATRLRQEISTHVSHLEVVQRGKEELARQQEELRGEVSLHQQRASVLQQSLEVQEVAMRVLKEQTESTREEATVKMEALQAQLEVVSSLATAKDLQLSTLREEATALQEQLAKREQEISRQKEVLQEAHMEKESVEALREELARQQEELREELIHQQQRAQSLEQSLEEQQEALKELTVKEERAREEATLKMVALQAAKDLELSTLRQEATQLRQEISTHVNHLEEVQRGKEEQEGNASEETTVKMAALQAQLEVVLSLAAAKDLQLSTLREEASLLSQENAKRAVDLKDVQSEKIRMESLLSEEHRALQEELAKEQEELRSEVSLHQQRAAELQQSLEEKQEALRELKEQLVQQQEDSSLQKVLQEAQAAALQEEAVDALRGEVTLHQQRAAELQQSLEHQEAALREQEAKSTEEATLKMEALQAAKDLQLSTLTEKATTLQQQLAKREQEISLQKEVLQEAHIEKESVEALREELARQQEELIHQQQRAQSLEQSLEEQQEALKELTVKEERAREEATLKMVALQAAKDLELSTLRQEATQLRQEISTHVSRLEEVQRGREEQEGNASEETTVKMEALQAQLEVVSSLATAKDLQLSTLREEATALQEQLAKREQEISLQKEVLQEAHLEKESVEALREELARQQEELREELIHQQQRAQSLEQSLEEQQEALKELTVKEERAREEATLKMVALQAAKDLELSTLRQEATQLRQEISTHVSRLEEVQSEGPLREEHTALQVQLAKQQEENSLQKGLLQEVQATVLQEREAKEILRGEVSLHQQSLEHQEAVLREDLARQKEEGQAAGQVEKELMEQFSVLQQEKEALLTRALQAEQNQSELEGSMAELRAQAESTESGQRQQLDALLLEKERLTEGNQVLEMKCSAAQRLEAVLQEELALLREQMEGTEWEKQVRHLREQLAANTEVVEHYKTQVEKAKSHYSGKKQQLVESQEQVTELQRSLEVREHEVNAVTTEMKLLQKELEKARSKEKSLGSKINTLEAQLAFADRHLREQSQVRPERGPGRIEKMRGGRESVYLKVPQSQTHQETSGDSLDLSLDDSLNTTTRPMEPDESSTPLVRSSERVAAKRRALGGDSLETLYFTPMNNRQINRTSTERRLQSSITSLGELALDSARKRPPTSSARRRRTTQVINITMSKTTPGRRGAGEDSDNETFYSLASVHSHPNITGRTHTARPVSMEIFHTPGKPAVALSDQLLSLPGYRRSTVHVAAPQSTGQFCVGAENEPDHAADDWLRIAELQARNQSCLPHLKSSYPLESRPSLGPSFEFTDDDLRMGDPTETIRRASVMPGQIQESLSSHRLSLHPGPADSTTATRPAYGSHRLSLMPPKPKASSTLNNQNTHNLRGSNLSLKRSAKDQEPDTPEAKRMATSCFPRPLTPKGGRFSSSNNRQPLSPAERRQSTVFSIDNTPRKAASKSGFLQRGMSKIRSSTRKSPGNKSSRVPQSGDRKSPRSGAGSVKSPQPGGKAQRKSPRTNSSKSPKNPTSARKEPEVLVGKPIHLSR
ncbi:nuclear mitotic apparatus protein 1 isoform X1 [Oncorhynchus tshawytscha]|uniref:nuclear mitotic apparatus protein 1 isoform X1 n=1 Tax=Oncorhynchus tshawytscha TaxID=74940 RepID=UPI001C3CAFAC|nr:nuclear mitotic apparatus protein 1 isoform X1 [Oncorhynchus tshawytscha]XP_042153556.1 nuclear mitotic apparatus protein 1 isoform X1 [Oncorhynchus tshawytscha]